MKIGELIRQKREEKGLTLKEVAEKCGMQRSNLSEIELGKRNVSETIFKKIFKVLGLDLYYVTKKVKKDL